MTMPLKSLTNPVVYWGKQMKGASHHLFIWQQLEFVNNLNSGRNIDEKLANYIVALLTGNQCMNYTKCYRPIEDYKKFINEKKLIFGISPNSKIDFKNLQYPIQTNEWHVIADGGVLTNYLTNFTDFYNFYGIIFNNETRSKFSLAKENICRLL